MMSLIPECRGIKNTIEQLNDILETTQLTVSQIYDSEFGATNSFAMTFGKIITQNLGVKVDDDKKAELHTQSASPKRGSPKRGWHPQNWDADCDVCIPKTGMQIECAVLPSYHHLLERPSSE